MLSLGQRYARRRDRSMRSLFVLGALAAEPSAVLAPCACHGACRAGTNRGDARWRETPLLLDVEGQLADPGSHLFESNMRE